MTSPSAGRLPNFLVIGAAKAGTTSLYRYLEQHPDVFMSAIKEPRFFALEGRPVEFCGPGDERVYDETATTLEGYRRLFARAGRARAVGEASVLYLPHPRAAAAIAGRIPDARLIVVLRNPAERAYSAFLYRTRDGYEPLRTFEAALADEPRRIAAGWYYGWHYRDQGFYHRHLRRYFERFDRARIRVHLHEDLVRDPLGVVRDLFAFLGVDPDFRPDVSVRHNPSGRPRNARIQRWLTRRHPLKEAIKRVVPEQWGHRVIARVQRVNLERPPLRPDTRAALTDGYREDVRQLEALLGRDLSHWLQ